MLVFLVIVCLGYVGIVSVCCYLLYFKLLLFRLLICVWAGLGFSVVWILMFAWCGFCKLLVIFWVWNFGCFLCFRGRICADRG